VILAVFALLVVLFVILPLVGAALWFVISSAIVGILFGALGRLIVPGTQPIGVLATVCCGLVGSLLGGGLSQAAHLSYLPTVLIEIGVSAAAVAVWSGTHRRPINRGGRARGVIDV
jgi:uncharacterized membrane protein YeaQ/YmgE (transglycosylase-associated protein family)